MTSTGVVTAAESTTVALESFSVPADISHKARPDSQTTSSYISRAMSSVWVLASASRNISQLGGYRGLAQGRGLKQYGSNKRRAVRFGAKMPAAAAGHAATNPVWRVRAATSCASSPPIE